MTALKPASTPWWHPARHATRRPGLVLRNRVRDAWRGWFARHDFVELETPALQISPGLEPHLHACATELTAPGEAPVTRYLHTSPEFTMKKLLAAGERRIVQFGRVFRDGERSALHHPEFTLVEWYRAGCDYRALIDDCAALLAAAAAAAGTAVVARRGVACDLTQAPVVVTVAEAFERWARIDLLAVLGDVDRFAAAARAIGVEAHDGDRWDDVFFRVMLDRIEPQLGLSAPCVLTDYPIAMAALARPLARDPRLAERFELYAAGVELANAFSELTDPVVQRQRFADDMALKQQLYGARYPIDEGFLAALAIMPEAAGIALGFDRLVMLLAGAERIDDVLWAPVE